MKGPDSSGPFLLYILYNEMYCSIKVITSLCEPGL